MTHRSAFHPEHVRKTENLNPEKLAGFSFAEFQVLGHFRCEILDSFRRISPPVSFHQSSTKESPIKERYVASTS